MKQKNYFSIVRATLLVLLGMLLVPSSLRAETKTTTIDFLAAAASKQNGNGATFTFGAAYSGITDAYIGNTMTYRPKNTVNADISRVAFAYNSTAGMNTTDGSGWYLYTERFTVNGAYDHHRGLYTGKSNTKLAVLDLIPGDVVRITYSGSTQSGDDANLHNDTQNYWFNQVTTPQGRNTQTVTINFFGDLILRANDGTVIESIVIESSTAGYEITEDKANKTSTFEFTAPGLLDQNSFTVEYLKVDFGNVNDYLVVQNTGGLQSSMYNKNTGSENLVTDGTQNWRPTGGNYYAFTPTASGQITVNGGLHGTCIHLFVYNIVDGSWDTDETHHYLQTWNQNDSHIHNLSFPVTKGKIYYICQDNTNSTEVQNENAFHLHKFTYVRSFNIKQLGVVVDDVDDITGDIALTQIENAGGTGGQSVTLKRCTGNIDPSSLRAYINQYGWLYMKQPTFTAGTDHAGTVIWDVVTDNGEGTVVVTFPYHADFGADPNDPTKTSIGHTWNFIDPRNSDSNFGNCWYKAGQSDYVNGTTSGILSIGQYKNTNSQFYRETENREWAWSRRVQGTNGTIHDPYYMNTYDMVGDNADMIWETEGLIFNTETNLSIIHNEGDPFENPDVTNPLNFNTGLTYDPDRYVGLLPDADGQSSFTIPGLKNGDRVLIFMKAGMKIGDEDPNLGIFLNVYGAKDAVGESIDPTVLYKAGGTNYIGGNGHTRYEGCYHFIKDGDGEMKFVMKGGSMCKLLYVRIYTGDRISTNNILANQYVGGSLADSGHLLFMNDKGATSGDYATLSLRFSGKVQHHASQVLTFSGNLKPSSFTGDNFKQSGTYEQNFDFKSTVGEIGMFRLRIKDLEYNKQYVGDFCDRNFTVGYRDKVDSYPYTWDFTDIQGFSSPAMSAEDRNYPIADAANDTYGNEWDISLFDGEGYMKVNSGAYPQDCNVIFAPHKIGFGNQLWAGGGVIPETRGLWFYRDDSGDSNSPLYNDCLQITQGGIRFCNTADVEGHKPWWNYKMVVPDVPADGAVYLRMKRDQSVAEADKMYSDQDRKNVLFLNTRFHFGTDRKTSLTEDGQNVYLTQENGSNYSFYQVPGTTDEYILAIKNNTGAVNHLTYTLNGWIVEKLAVSTDSKNIGSTGFATESRDHAIDHTLTSYMTGLPIKAYMVTNAVASTAEQIGFVTVTPVEFSDEEINAVLPANTGCFLANDMYNEEATDKSVKVVNNQTHLFVPDMHDASNSDNYVSTTGNMMKARAQAGYIPATEGGMTNFVLSNKYVYVDNPDVEITNNKVNFYRVIERQINGQTVGATTGDNSAYLQIRTSTANGVKAFFLVMEGSEDPLAEDFGDQDITAVKGIENAADIEGNWYNMNGQKLNGRPTSSGIYVVNGKKVVIK